LASVGRNTADHSYIEQSQRHLLAENVQVAIGRRRVAAPSVEIPTICQLSNKERHTKKLHSACGIDHLLLIH
jgi:hypothetical protein